MQEDAIRFFTLVSQSSVPRSGLLRTTHGSFQTPLWIPCTRKGAPTNLTPDLGQQLMEQAFPTIFQIGLHDLLVRVFPLFPIITSGCLQF